MGIEHFGRLGAEQRATIAAHFLALDKGSRDLRFGSRLPDASLVKYVAGIDFEKDIVEGAWDDDTLVGVAHLAVYAHDGHAVGELGISVLMGARHRHLGQRLLDRTLVHARLRGLWRVHVQFLVRNRPMGRLACEFTKLIDVSGGDAHAVIDMTELVPALA